MKKLLYTLLALALIISAQSISSRAAESGNASITVAPKTVDANPGDTVTFTLTANNSTGIKVEAISGTFSADEGLTIDHSSANILCDKYFDSSYNEKAGLVGTLSNSKSGTSDKEWQIIKINCKVDSNATVGKKEFTFTVGDFRPTQGDRLINKDTKITATINVTHTGEHTWNTGEVTKEATCTETGEKTFKCTVPGCNGTKTEAIPALGHQNLTITKPFTWTENSQDKTKTTAKTTVTCSRSGCEYYNGKEVDVTDIKVDVKNATCVNPDDVVFTGTLTIGDVSATDTYTIKGTALGHQWGAPECVWEKNGQVSATRHCMREGDTNTHETANAVGELHETPASCEKEGSRYYMASLKFTDASGEQSVDVQSDPETIPATGHKWPETVTFNWDTVDPENPTATVVVKCENEGCDFAADQSLTATVSEEARTPAKCEEKGSITYKATAETPGANPKTYTDTTKVELAELGHKWSEKVTFNWTETPDNYTAEAVRLCENDGTHKDVVTAKIEKQEIKVVNCGYDGQNKYTATATFGDNKTASETKEEIIPATGKHTLADWVTEEAATYKAEGKKSRTCTVCGKKIEVETIPRLEPETKVEVDKGEATVDTASLENYLDKVVDSVLAGAKPTGMPQEIIDAILAAGNSTNPGSLTVSAKLVVDDAANQSITGIDADSILKTYNIHIDVTVDGEGVNGVTGQITETSQPISFTVPKPEGGPIYYVMRDHSGWAKIGSRVDGSNIIFSSNLFSDFSIISSNNLADADVEPIPNQTYTGKEITPKVKVTINGGEELTEGVDYTVTYSNNTEIGTATVVIKAVEGSDARFTGSNTVTFQIVKQADDANGAGAAGNGNNKNTSSPATGDEASIALYAVLAIFAAVVAAGVALRRRYQK